MHGNTVAEVQEDEMTHGGEWNLTGCWDAQPSALCQGLDRGVCLCCSCRISQQHLTPPAMVCFWDIWPSWVEGHCFSVAPAVLAGQHVLEGVTGGLLFSILAFGTWGAAGFHLAPMLFNIHMK